MDLQKTLSLIAAGRTALPKIKSIGKFFDYVTQFHKEAKGTRPLDVSSDEEYGAPDPAHLKTLENLHYPADYIEWATQYGHFYLWLESTKISRLDSVVTDSHDYYRMLTRNNYLFLTSDGGGNLFAFDLNESKFSIKFFDHDYYITEGLLEEFYSEELGFYYDEDKKQYVNPKKLDPALILDAEGVYILDSPYIKKYLKNKNVGQPVKAKDFLSFLIAKTLEGFDDFNFRYSDLIERFAKVPSNSDTKMPVVVIFYLGEFEQACGSLDLNFPKWMYECPFYIYDQSFSDLGLNFPDEEPISDADCKTGFAILHKICVEYVAPSASKLLFDTVFEKEFKNNKPVFAANYGFAPGYDIDAAIETAENQNVLVIRWDEYWNTN